MPDMTGQQVRDYIVNTFIRTDKDTQIYEAITDTIRDMRRRFGYDEDKTETVSLGISTIGQYQINLPADFGRLISDIRMIDGIQSYTLNKLSKLEFDELYPNPQASNVYLSRPEDACIFAGQILLGPVPDSLSYTYGLSYSVEDSVDITSGTAVVPFSRLYRETVKSGSLFRLFRDLGNDQEAGKWAGVYEKLVEESERRERKNTEGVGATMYNAY